MGEVVVVPARLEHAFVLAQYMRPKDVAEMEACGLTPLEGVLQGLRMSQASFAALYDDVVGAMFGVTAANELWLLTSHLFGEKPIAFCRAAKHCLGALLERHPVLGNLIDARHDDALRFVVVLGGRLGPAVPFGRSGELFVPFQIRRA